MKVNQENCFLECLHLDYAYMGLTVQNMMTVSEAFNLLDVHNDELLNDLQVKIWMKHNTDLKLSEVITIFELIDIYASGFFDLEIFYFLCSIIIAAKDHVEKDFINRHSRSIYNLFETRMKGKMTYEQFVMVGWLFGYEESTIKFFHNEFDVSKSKKIPYEEFKLYALICIELQDMIDGRDRIVAFHKYRKRLVMALKPKLVKYVKHDIAPRPSRLIRAIRWVQRPYVKKGRGVHRLNPYQRVRKGIQKRWKIMMEHCCRCKCCHRRRRRCCRKKKKKHPHQHEDVLRRRSGRRKCSLINCFRCCNKKAAESDRGKDHVWDQQSRTKKKWRQEDEDSDYSNMPSWIMKLDELKKKKSRHHLAQFQAEKNQNNIPDPTKPTPEIKPDVKPEDKPVTSAEKSSTPRPSLEKK